jgi:hypothetical protein
MTTETIKDYLNDPEIFEELNLVKSGAIKLHWSNWDRLLNKLKDRVVQGDVITSKSDIDKKFEIFQRTPVWLFNKSGRVESNLYELYHFYLDPRMKELWFELNEETLISLKGEAGPFLRLQSMRWFDCEVYKYFVYNKLLNDQNMKVRSFRLSVDIPIECSFNNTIIQSIYANIIQISKGGVLMKFNNISDLNKFKRQHDVVFRANFAPFLKAKKKRFKDIDSIFTKGAFKDDKDLTSFRLRANILELGTNKVNVNFSSGDDFYVYFGFDDLLESDKNEIKNSIVSFVDFMETNVAEHLDDKAEARAS